MYLILPALLIIVVIFLAVERLRLEHSRRRLKLRILVNGTRGKSTTVRIIHRMLNQADYRALGRVTGEIPALLFPDGQEEKTPRKAPASIIEILRLINSRHTRNCDAIVIECMALQAETQQALAAQIVRPRFTLITNFLPDHAEIAGGNTPELLQNCLIPQTQLILNEANKTYISGNPCTIHIAAADTAAPEPGHIPAAVLHESLQLVLKLAELLNIPEDIVNSAFSAEWQSINRQLAGKALNANCRFINLFTANDTISSSRLIDHLSGGAPIGFLLNSRSDRPLRTKEFCNLLIKKYRTAPVLLTGTGRRLAGRILRQSGHLGNVITLNPHRHNLHAQLVQMNTALIFGIGNNRGMEQEFTA